MFNFTALPPLSLYVHIPWCVRKCPYCDFNSHEARTPIPEAEYINALVADLEQDIPRIWGRTVESIFIGGGTPSLFSAEALERLLSQIRALVPLSPAAEITLEANPGTVETEKFMEFHALGINRLSLGIQSFNDSQLALLGRIHGRDEALAAAEAAQTSGFDNFNLDLMFGLPNQTTDEALADVTMAVQLEPTHISLYQLTIEPNTLFHHQPPSLPEDDTIYSMQLRCQDLLMAHGYTQYEISAYAQPGRQCKHNLNYWRFGDYLGIGAGAHGKITDAKRQCITRIRKHRHPQEYLSKSDRISSETTLKRQEVPLEFMMNTLRLREGFESRLFSERTGLPLSNIEKGLRKAEELNLINWDVTAIQPSAQGYRYLNDLVALFLPD